MTNSTALTPETLPAIMWQNQPVITTELLAQIYGTAVNNIQMNFTNNANRFIEGVHYFLLKGADLKAFKANPISLGQFAINKFTRSLYLWTERGTVRHAKILDTDNAWAVQERLENFYFANQPAKPVQRDFVNEPLKITCATKEQREPLVKAVRGLVLTAKSKGRNISFEEAHQMVNFSIGVTSVEEMTVEMIPLAIKSVGELFKTIVLEGDYIARGELELKSKVEPEIVSEPMSYKDREALTKINKSLSRRFHYEQVWSAAISFRLRKVTGVKSPAYFRECDKTIMAKEFETIFTIVRMTQDVIRKVELESARRLMRNDEEFNAVLAEFEAEVQLLFTELENDVKVLLDTRDKYEIKQFAA